MLKYIFKKGELNSLNNLNQDLKTVFKTYALCYNGLIVGTPTFKGVHYGKTEYTFPEINMGDFMIIIESADLFKVIKENKKNIIGYSIDDNGDLSLYGEDTSHPIGQVLSMYGDAVKPYHTMLEDVYKTAPDLDDDIISLSEEDVEDMVKNKIKSLVSGKYRTRISREVIPGLKKTYSVSVKFYDYTDDVFTLHISDKRPYASTEHIYKCLYI